MGVVCLLMFVFTLFCWFWFVVFGNSVGCCCDWFVVVFVNLLLLLMSFWDVVCGSFSWLVMVAWLVVVFVVVVCFGGVWFLLFVLVSCFGGVNSIVCFVVWVCGFGWWYNFTWFDCLVSVWFCCVNWVFGGYALFISICLFCLWFVILFLFVV